ncbi:hypothetical protein [Asaia lannensis]|uniref:hypothetical protein n=1 Tax=Asaia lannensis TaxID=415421 RepID=UPI001C99571F
MHSFNNPTFETTETVNLWNDHVDNTDFAFNSHVTQHDYYESKMVFDNHGHEADSAHESVCSLSNHLDEAISFLGTGTGLLKKAHTDPVSIRVVWNLLENVSRVYLPQNVTMNDPDTICLSVKGDPYAVRENGVMLDALNYVRTLLSETSRVLPAL